MDEVRAVILRLVHIEVWRTRMTDEHKSIGEARSRTMKTETKRARTASR